MANHLSSGSISSGLSKGLVAGESINDSCIEQRAVRRAERRTLLTEKVIGDRDPMVGIGNDEIMARTCIFTREQEMRVRNDESVGWARFREAEGLPSDLRSGNIELLV
ncbi:hypothetical protein [Bradyrhizobium sp. BR 1432]|uniref:hypothetical protein n=1 Tax=Bradyrhizobium sp. BR 1432 TaxID=3447966 RepID=UPI003EE47EA3